MAKALTIISVILLFFSCLSGFVNPNVFWPLSFAGFAFPLILLLNLLIFLIWLIRWKPFALLPFIAVSCTWQFIHSTFAFNFFSANKQAGIKLMTWNVRNFDLYNWSNNIETRKKIMQLIRKENPDVLCLQEFYTNNQLFHNLEFIRDTLGYKYCYFPPAVELLKTPQTKLQKTLWRSGPLEQEWGVATFSKYPFIDTGRITFDNAFANSCIFTDINFDGKTMRLYNVHFQSIHLGYEDYATLDELQETKPTKWNSLKNIISKMKVAYLRRAQQADAVAQSMNSYTGAKIICGDFNDVPVSYVYKQMNKGMADAFIEKGKGVSPTFINKLSLFRIDYALFGSEMQVNSYKVIHKELSDHYPVCVSFENQKGE